MRFAPDQDFLLQAPGPEEMAELYEIETQTAIQRSHQRIDEQFASLPEAVRQVLKDILEIQEQHRQAANKLLQAASMANPLHQGSNSPLDRGQKMYSMPYDNRTQSANIEDHDRSNPRVRLTTQTTTSKWMGLATDTVHQEEITIHPEGTANIRRVAKKGSWLPVNDKKLVVSTTVGNTEDLIEPASLNVHPETTTRTARRDESTEQGTTHVYHLPINGSGEINVESFDGRSVLDLLIDFRTRALEAARKNGVMSRNLKARFGDGSETAIATA